MIRNGLFCCLALVALIGFAFQASAIIPVDCTCEPGWWTTEPTWGMSTTCAGARADAEDNAWTKTACDVCEHYFVEVTSCVDYQGMKRVDVVLYYKCLYCRDDISEVSAQPPSTVQAVGDLLEPASPQLTPAMIPAGNGCGAATR